MHKTFLMNIYRKSLSDSMSVNNYHIIYNPLINENLKIYL